MNKIIVLSLILFSIALNSQTTYEYSGVVKDKNTGTTIEDAIVLVQPSRIFKAGYYSGVKTKKDGAFSVRSTYGLPSFLKVSKNGCTSKKIKIKEGEKYFEVLIKCDSSTIEEIITARNSDDDLDGVINYDDDCPNEAGDPNNNGCPWPDTDNDGVFDKDDKCINEVGDPNNSGCPSDRDNDGVNDNEDKCPNEAGDPKNNGCPILPKKLLSLLESDQRNILFEANVFQLNQSGINIISEIAQELKQFPNVRIRVSGHASSDGSRGFNQILSEKRALEIKKYLMDKEIDSSRIEIKAFGEDAPEHNNNTKEGRAKNRRANIAIIEMTKN